MRPVIQEMPVPLDVLVRMVPQVDQGLLVLMVSQARIAPFLVWMVVMVPMVAMARMLVLVGMDRLA
jgi:hypothetical protein